jgi:hypothetical protein
MPASHRVATILLCAAAALPRAAPAAGAANLPRTLLLLAEQNIGMAAPEASWTGKDAGGLPSADLRVAESVVLEELRKAGFGHLVDPEIAGAQAASLGELTTQITVAQARKLGSLTGAEVIILGQARAHSRDDLPELGPGWRTCAATLSARVVATASGEILATSEATQSAAHLDDLTCGKEAIAKAGKVLAADAAKKIGERWSSRVASGSNGVYLRVKNVGSVRQAGEFRGALSQFIRGVKGVSQRRFEGGTQELDVQLLGSTEQFAQELQANKLGKFWVKVKRVTATTVCVELGKKQQRDSPPKR